MFPDLTSLNLPEGITVKESPEIREILEQCYLSTKIFAKTFFPDDVSAEFNLLHDDIFEVIDNPNYRKKGVAAPRGLGKTTLAKIRACKAILYRECGFIIYLSNSASSAEMATEDIKRMLLANSLIKRIFGDIRVANEGLEDTFSKKSWSAFGEVFILPRGAGQQVRGLNWRGNRPGLIVIDDLENSEAVKSEDQRTKLKQWFFSDLLRTESMFGQRAEFLYIDTIKHEDALLQNLVDSDDWYTKVLAICDADFNSYDPNYMTTEEIKEDYNNYKQMGETDLFFMELMNIPISLEDAAFKPSYFKYYELEGDRIKHYDELDPDKELTCYLRDLVICVICDPAKTVKMQSADSALVTIGVHRESHKIFVLDIFSGKVKPDELYEKMFDFVIRWRALILAVEVISLNEFISQPIEQEMRIRSIYPHYIELKAVGKKEIRVSTLAFHYRMGYVYHNKTNCHKLEAQLQWFPKSKLWDVMDAFSYITKLMDEQAIFFDPDSDFQEPEDYSELDDYNEEPLTDEWRLI